MKRVSTIALILVSVVMLSGCDDGEKSQPSPAVTTKSTEVEPTEPAVLPVEPVPSVPEVVEPPAVELTVEQTLVQITETSFNDILRVAPGAFVEFEELSVYVETEGQRRWEEQNPGGAYLPDTGFMMFSEAEESELIANAWKTEEFMAAFDDISFKWWSGDSPGFSFLTTTMYYVNNMRTDLHDYQIDIPESAFIMADSEDSYTLDTSMVTITRDGEVVSIDYGYIALLWYEKVDGVWKISPEEASIVFPFESLAV